MLNWAASLRVEPLDVLNVNYSLSAPWVLHHARLLPAGVAEAEHLRGVQIFVVCCQRCYILHWLATPRISLWINWRVSNCQDHLFVFHVEGSPVLERKMRNVGGALCLMVGVETLLCLPGLYLLMFSTMGILRRVFTNISSFYWSNLSVCLYTDSNKRRKLSTNKVNGRVWRITSCNAFIFINLFYVELYEIDYNQF